MTPHDRQCQTAITNALASIDFDDTYYGLVDKYASIAESDDGPGPFNLSLPELIARTLGSAQVPFKLYKGERVFWYVDQRPTMTFDIRLAVSRTHLEQILTTVTPR